MLSDSQKSVFKQVADNKAVFECLKEHLLSKFAINDVPLNQTDDHIGMMVRAKIDGARTIESVFTEIAAYKTLPTQQTGGNPAR